MFRGDVPRRLVVLVHDKNGRELSFAKIADDDVGREMLAPVAWRPRVRPWYLGTELARAIGRFDHEVATGSVDHPAHGHSAPWNVIRTQGLVSDRPGKRRIDISAVRRSLSFPRSGPYATRSPEPPRVDQRSEGTRWVSRTLDAYAAAAGAASIDRHEAMIEFLTDSIRSDGPIEPPNAVGRRETVAPRT